MADTKAYLDLILLALEAFTGMSSEEMLEGAKFLQVHTIITDRIALWRLRQASPLRRSKGGRKKLDIEEALALVRVSAYLASKYHQELRQAVEKLSFCQHQRLSPHREPVLGDYLNRFYHLYNERLADKSAAPQVEKLALKLLVDLFFCSAKAGAKHLWLMLLEL